MGNTGNLKSCFALFFCSLRGQAREKQRRCLPADGEKPDSSSPCQSGEPAALPWAEHHRSHAQQSKCPAYQFAPASGNYLREELISIGK